MKNTFWIMLVGLAVAMPAQATKVYKWHDETGQVQYTQTPPQSGQEYEIVEPGEAVGATSRVERGEPIARPADDEPEQADDPENAEADERDEAVHVVSREDARKACAEAQERLETLRDGGSMLMTRDEQGELRQMSEEEIEQRISEELSRVKQFCTD
ncbi:MAG: DUF4124 domain-containing protein [Halothiobacillaceae bacterium]